MKRNQRLSNCSSRVSCQPICVECGDLGVLVSGRVAYPAKPEWAERCFYRCACGALVSCHPGTAIAAGRPGSARTRWARAKVHEAFDLRWNGGGSRMGNASGRARRKAYAWLARQLGIDVDACHVGWFDEATCWRVVEACSPAVGAAA